MTGRTAIRARILFVAVASLLFQQFALAAYSCPAVPVIAPATSGHCEGRSAHVASSNPALCAGHCAVSTPAPSDASPKAPAAWVLPTVFSLVLPAPQRVSAVARSHHALASVPDPPPRLRYCSLLI